MAEHPLRKLLRRKDWMRELGASRRYAFCEHADQDNVDCSCGEEEKEFAWVWSTREQGGQAGSLSLGENCRQVIFNPGYSSGTAAVRGSKPLRLGQHHYWEFKMTKAVYGTDIMIGVCTPKFDIKYGVRRFCSLLGRDEESWGYSYTGSIQHRGKFLSYGPQWGKGSILGVHLDLWCGSLQFFLNRKPLGVAFTGIQNKELYPVVASTSAHSGMKIICSCTFPVSLQFLSSEVVFRHFCKKMNVRPEDLTLPPGLRAFVENNYWPLLRSLSDVQDGIVDENEILSHITPKRKLGPHECEEEDLPREKKLCKEHLEHPSLKKILQRSSKVFTLTWRNRNNDSSSVNASEPSSSSSSSSAAEESVEHLSHPSSSEVCTEEVLESHVPSSSKSNDNI